MAWPGRRSFRRGPTSVVHMFVSSRGGPGSVTRILPSRSIHQLGAVPIAFKMAVADGIMRAWRRLDRGIGRMLRREKFSSSHVLSSGATLISSPSILAMASRVTSSSVGPRPPMVMMTPERPQARSRASVRRPMSSPTIVTHSSSSPSSGSRMPSHEEFVSCVSPISSSVPTATISAFIVRASRVPHASSGSRRAGV